METLQELLISQLSLLYAAERELVVVLPDMAAAASSEKLRWAIEEHTETTRQHVERLENAFERLETSPIDRTCRALAGLIEECCDVIESEGTPEVKDAALIAAMQQVEHYELSAYGTARSLSETLGLVAIAELLQQTLDEERDADSLLNNLAVMEINEGALAASL